MSDDSVGESTCQAEINISNDIGGDNDGNDGDDDGAGASRSGEGDVGGRNCSANEKEVVVVCADGRSS